jgi:peptide/nickel transport system substrate-binding protein
MVENGRHSERSKPRTLRPAQSKNPEAARSATTARPFLPAKFVILSTAKNLLISSLLLLVLLGCHSSKPDATTVVMAIENSPTSLDPRIGTDAMSERIGGLLFDALVIKDEHFELRPWLATSWQQPDPLTWLFHLREGVRFHDGRPLTAADAAFTINSFIDGSLVTSKAGAFASVGHAEATDPLTLTIHMKRPDASLLFNLSDGLFGVVPAGSGKDFGRNPIGSGPYKFISAQQDNEVLVARNAAYWHGPPKLDRVRFAVIPDAVTVALELEKGSADIASNQLTLDMVHALEARPNLAIESAPGSPVMYLNFNVANGPLADTHVRQAIAFAMDRPAIIHAVWRDKARLASSLLPEGHWAEAPTSTLAQYPHDLARAQQLLESAGYHPDKSGTRLHLEMKISTDETTRLLAEILQQQLAAAGMELTLRSSEFGTFYADVTSGRFQMYALRWIGSNEDPDIYRYTLGSDRTPPKGANRGHYSNPQIDALLSRAADTTDEPTRRQDFIAAQQILARDLPTIPLWFPNNEVVHTTRVQGIVPRLDGSFGFLRDAYLR